MAICPTCKKVIDDYALKCKHCKADLDGDPPSEPDNFLKKFSRLSVVTAIVLIFWNYHIFSTRYHVRSFAEFIRTILFIPMYVFMVFFPLGGHLSPRVADGFGGGESITGILIFTLVSLPGAYFYSYLILRIMKISGSYYDVGQYYPPQPFYKYLIIVFCILFAVSFIPYSAKPSYVERYTDNYSCKSNLRNIWSGLGIYSNLYDDKFPPYDGEKGLKILADEGYFHNRDNYICPTVKYNTRWDEKRKEALKKDFLTDYEYKGGLSEDEEEIMPICWDKENNHTKSGHVLYTDGKVREFKGKDWMKKIKPIPVEKIPT